MSILPAAAVEEDAPMAFAGDEDSPSSEGER